MPVTWFPQMAMTLVRRASAKLPHNHFLFRVEPKRTKAEIREYLTKVYGVSVVRVATSISLGKTRRVPAHMPHMIDRWPPTHDTRDTQTKHKPHTNNETLRKASGQPSGNLPGPSGNRGPSNNKSTNYANAY